MPYDADVLILGAGPAGLMAAYELTRAGRTAVVLEARARIGGRVHTIWGGDDGPLELGAEFIHGDLPLTQALLEETGLSYTPTGGRWVQVQSGEVREEDDDASWSVLLRKMKALEEDLPLQDFLTTHFPEPKWAALVARAVAYAEGYDTADASRASTQALYAEWSHEDEHQYRIDAGYSALLDAMTATAQAAGGCVLTGHPVMQVATGLEKVTVTVAGGETFTAPQAILALPLGVLQSDASPAITPVIPIYTNALRTLGFGDVLKIVLCFRSPFWEAVYPGLGFLLSGAAIPTWWTPAPAKRAFITGWLGGRTARIQAGRPEADLLEEALQSLAGLFSRPVASLREELVEAHVAAWSAEPYTRGAYNYGTVGGAAARSVLSQPLGGRLHFAGEYMHPDGPVTGTVEAAFWSGQEAARHVLVETGGGVAH